MNYIDFRSDTVTKPSDAMRRVMAEAEVGDDVYGEDSTVNRLEEYAAELLGKEAAIYASSGTQTNLLALLSHCQRGEEYIVGQLAHTYKYEAGGAAVLGSIQPQPLDFEADGTLDLEKIEQTVKPDDYHFARTRLLCLENTHNGMTLPMEYLARADACRKKHGLKMHLDGARIFNAAAKTGRDAAEIAACFDSVSVCLSKGLGAPVGSVLCADRGTIEWARRWRKMLGGGMRQAGIIAAAGIFALENNRDRLQEDHDNARILAQGLEVITTLEVDYVEAQTNMVFVSLPPEAVTTLKPYLADNNILISAGQRIRLVTHLDISREQIDQTITLVRSFFS
jgi:threonine aldolase